MRERRAAWVGKGQSDCARAKERRRNVKGMAGDRKKIWRETKKVKGREKEKGGGGERDKLTTGQAEKERAQRARDVRSRKSNQGWGERAGVD